MTKKSLKDKLPPMKCKGCGTNFIPKDRRQHYHSETCREEYYARVFFSKVRVRKTCPNCGTVFPTTKPGRQNYCSPKCREEAAQKRRDSVTTSLSTESALAAGNRFAILERDGFKCTYCGRGVHDGVKLDVEDCGDGSFRTICDTCKAGKPNSDIH